jgi:hypothetical protein
MTSLRSRCAALTTTLVIAACGANGDPGSPDATASPDAPGDATVDVAPAAFVPMPFDDTYEAHDVLSNRCDHLVHIAGSEPTEPGRYPLAIFLVGTNAQYAGPGIVDHVLPLLASHGFVAASLEYQNATLFGAAQNCNLYQDNASCMVRNDGDYVHGDRRSALARLCGRADVDCGKGVVVLGHSQGGLTALQTFRFAPVTPPGGEPVPKLVAAAPMGVGPTGYLLGVAVIHLDACVAAATLAVDPHELLVVNGENDAYFNGPHADPAGGQIALEAVTGRACPGPSWDCRGRGGDGYVLVKKSQTSTGRATHGYMDEPGVGAFEEPTWSSPENPDAWGLDSTARWLFAQTRQ